MENNGFILVHRKLIDSKVFANETALKIWIWCLISANHKDNHLTIGGHIETIKRGQFHTGRFTAEKALKINGNTWYKWMKFFESEKMISLKSNSNGTTVTICNYDSYQASKNEKVTAVQQNSNRISTELQQNRNTNNNVNNENNDNNENKWDAPAPARELQENFFEPTKENLHHLKQQGLMKGITEDEIDAFILNMNGNGWTYTRANNVYPFKDLQQVFLKMWDWKTTGILTDRVKKIKKAALNGSYTNTPEQVNGERFEVIETPNGWDFKQMEPN